MGQLNFSNINPSVERRILAFLNRAFSPTDITNLQLVKTEEADKEDYGIGETVAQRIITHKRQYPRFRFSELTQLNGIQGFGQDKFDDLANTLAISSAERFRKSLFSTQVLLENWEVKIVPIVLDSEEEFMACSEDDRKLRPLIAEYFPKLADDSVSQENIDTAKGQIKSSFIDGFENPHIGSFAFALWWYLFDQDNWFSFERIRQVIEPFLSESANYRGGPVVSFIRGFENRLIYSRGITVTGLPIVFNSKELSIYLIGAQLFD